MTPSKCSLAILPLLAALLATAAEGAQTDLPLIVRPDPPARDDFEADDDGDGVPDGWYNLRDATMVAEGGVSGPGLVRFEADRPSRPARISRGFGLDGRKTEALIIGLWVRRHADPIVRGERIGEEPRLMIDLLDANLQSTHRGEVGPWGDLPADRWVLWKSRVHVPPDTRDAIMTVGLLGATGTLDVDGLTIEQLPVDPVPTTNLVINGGFELGGMTPSRWLTENGAHRSYDPDRSTEVLELTAINDRALIPIAVPVDRIGRLSISMNVRAEGLRGAGGARPRSSSSTTWANRSPARPAWHGLVDGPAHSPGGLTRPSSRSPPGPSGPRFNWRRPTASASCRSTTSRSSVSRISPPGQ